MTTAAVRPPRVPVRVWIVWTALIVATVASWWLGDDHGPRRAASVGILLLAFGKVYLVAEHFMDVRRAPLVLRLLVAGWTVTITTTLVVMYLIAD
jgi:caa(3)-type oxidase subunit IV